MKAKTVLELAYTRRFERVDTVELEALTLTDDASADGGDNVIALHLTEDGADLVLGVAVTLEYVEAGMYRLRFTNGGE